jgi:Fe2+ transport system protein FeoA
MHSLVPLSLLRVGQTGVVRQVLGEAEYVHRLSEMGLRRGATIEVMQPGRPCIVRIAGHKLCFRDDELNQVFVEPGAAA